MKQTKLLIILDGWGHSDSTHNNAKATPNEMPDPKPIEIPMATLSRAIPKVIATPTPMLVP